MVYTETWSDAMTDGEKLFWCRARILHFIEGDRTTDNHIEFLLKLAIRLDGMECKTCGEETDKKGMLCKRCNQIIKRYEEIKGDG